jgi:hypothetical protein
MSKNKNMKRIKSKSQLCFKRCQDLWREIVYLRSENKSEISGKPTDKKNRNAHHVKGKSNYLLRFDTRNGINLTYYEHDHGIHCNDPDRVIYYNNLINEALKKREGNNILEILEMEKTNYSKSDIFMIELRLRQELKALKEGA